MDGVVKHSLKNTIGTSITAFFNNMPTQKSKGEVTDILFFHQSNYDKPKQAKWIEIYQLQPAEENPFP